MKKSDIKRMQEVQDKDFNSWLVARQKAWDELSEKYSMFCVCGKLCSGLHENGCKRFQDAINLRAIKNMEDSMEVEK